MNSFMKKKSLAEFSSIGGVLAAIAGDLGSFPDLDTFSRFVI
jgi:hypothetical protein